MSTGTTLYYPYIHPRQAGHLKAALLYWDRVRRIVPDSVTHGNQVSGDDNDSRLLSDEGLLVSTRPEPYQQRAADLFFEHLEPIKDRFTIDIGAAREMANRNRGIHIEKIGLPVFHKLHDLGLAQKFGEWVSMHDEIGAFYMFCLASEMSAGMSTTLFTDSPDDAAIGEALLFDPNDANVTRSETLVRLGINLPSPDQLEHLSMQTIVKFVRSRSAEKQRFRATVEAILETARSYQDRNAVDDYLASQRGQVEAAVNDFRLTLDELEVGVLSETAKITVPAGFAAVVAVMHVPPVAAALLASLGIAISAISCFAETRGKLRAAKAASPYHYLVALSDELKIKTEV